MGYTGKNGLSDAALRGFVITTAPIRRVTPSRACSVRNQWAQLALRYTTARNVMSALADERSVLMDC
jgi:hypothetical protein